MGRHSSLELRLEGINLLAKEDILLFGFLYADLKVGEVLCLACAIVSLLEEGTRRGYGHVLSASAGHSLVRVFNRGGGTGYVRGGAGVGEGGGQGI